MEAIHFEKQLEETPVESFTITVNSLPDTDGSFELRYHDLDDPSTEVAINGQVNGNDIEFTFAAQTKPGLLAYRILQTKTGGELVVPITGTIHVKQWKYA